MGFPGGSVVKNLPAIQETQVWPLVAELGTTEKTEEWEEGHRSVPNIFLFLCTNICIHFHLLQTKPIVDWRVRSSDISLLKELIDLKCVVI